MPIVHCFTSATFSYLPQVRVLGETLRKHQPDWIFWLCLCDEAPEGFVFDLAKEPIDHVVRLSALDIGARRPWLFEHNIVELCTAVKGTMLCRLMDQGAEKVVYIDPDIALFADLTAVEDLLDQHNVVLTPHQLQPDTDRGAIIDNEIGSLKFGIYNLGFLAVANTDEGRRFAQWWRDRLLEFCFDDVPNGLFTDQRWCDHVPAFFEGVHILRDEGYNVASWNLSRRPITIETDGSIRAAGRTLRFFHFTKVNWVGEIMMERYSGGRIEVFELMHWYRAQLTRHQAVGVPAGWWAYGNYDNGVAIPQHHRTAYRMQPGLQSRFPNPFGAGPDAIEFFLAGNGQAD